MYDLSIDRLCPTGEGYDEFYLPIRCSNCVWAERCMDSPYYQREEDEE